MTYGVAAGLLVTLSLLLLAIESSNSRVPSRSTGFIGLYGLGVFFWLLLGIVMDNGALVVISSLQIFFLAIFAFSERSQS